MNLYKNFTRKSKLNLHFSWCGDRKTKNDELLPFYMTHHCIILATAADDNWWVTFERATTIPNCTVATAQANFQLEYKS